MELRSLLPLVVACLVALVLFRVVLGAIKTSAKLMVWAVVAAAVFGLGYIWYENQGLPEPENLPTLNIPSFDEGGR